MLWVGPALSGIVTGKKGECYSYHVLSCICNIVLIRFIQYELIEFGILRKPAGQADSLLFANVVRG